MHFTVAVSPQDGPHEMTARADQPGVRTPRPQALPVLGAPVLACQTDERLVELFRSGHDAAFEALVRRYRRPLLAYSRRLLPDERSEDALQQAFLNAYRAMRDGTGELRVRPWLYRIVHNAALDVLRRSCREELPLSDDHEAVEHPDQVFERRERLRETIAAVQALPQRQRDAIVLQELEGRSHEEIASRIGISEGAVRQLIHRARGSLRAAAAAIFPLSVLDASLRAPRAEAFAVRLPELVSGAAAGGGVAKATLAVMAVSAVAGGGAVGTGSFDGSPPVSVARGSVTAVAPPPARPAGEVAGSERGGKPERSSRPRRTGERIDRRATAADGRSRASAPAKGAEGGRRSVGGEREQRQTVERPQLPPLAGSGAPERSEPPKPVEVEDEYEAPDEPDSAGKPEYEAPDEPDSAEEPEYEAPDEPDEESWEPPDPEDE